MFDIAVLDDEQVYLDATVSIINEYCKVHSDIDIKLHTFTSPYDILGRESEFDMYLLDIVMPEMTGIDVAAMLREKGFTSPIVFLTGTRDFAVESYTVNAFNYLLKPVDKDKLFNVLDKALEFIDIKSASLISAKTPNGVELISFNRIVYIEFSDRRVCYHLSDGEVIRCNQQRSSFAESIQPIMRDRRFCRCGASYVLNLHFVKSIKKYSTQFKSIDTELHLPRSAYSSVLTAWLDYWTEVEK